MSRAMPTEAAGAAAIVRVPTASAGVRKFWLLSIFSHIWRIASFSLKARRTSPDVV
jgi:hypothetical protein